MRLQEMYYLVCNTLENWVNPVIKEHKADVKGDVTFSCDNAQAIVNLLEPLRILPSVNEKIEKIFTCSNRFMTEEIPYLSGGSVNTIRNNMAGIKNDLIAMVAMCEALGVEPNSDGFDVKLPPNITLDELADCTKDLNTIFSQCPMLRHEDGKISLNGVDVGSAWLTFTVVGVGAAFILKNLAALVDKAVIIRSHYLDCKRQEESVRAAQLANDLLETQVEINKALLKAKKDTILEQMKVENGITDPEEIGRLNHSIELLSGLMNKGLEIYAAVGGGKDIKAAFPPLEEQALPDGLPKLLESIAETSKTE